MHVGRTSFKAPVHQFDDSFISKFKNFFSQILSGEMTQKPMGTNALSKSDVHQSKNVRSPTQQGSQFQTVKNNIQSRRPPAPLPIQTSAPKSEPKIPQVKTEAHEKEEAAVMWAEAYKRDGSITKETLEIAKTVLPLLENGPNKDKEENKSLILQLKNQIENLEPSQGKTAAAPKAGRPKQPLPTKNPEQPPPTKDKISTTSDEQKLPKAENLPPRLTPSKSKEQPSPTSSKSIDPGIKTDVSRRDVLIKVWGDSASADACLSFEKKEITAAQLDNFMKIGFPNFPKQRKELRKFYPNATFPPLD